MAAERALVALAQRTDGRVVSDSVVDLALLESAANGVTLNPAQADLVRQMATSGARLQLAIAPAGSGKTTAMRVLARAWKDSGGNVIGLAPSAVAASALADQIGSLTDTLAKLTYSLTHDRIPAWVSGIGSDSLVVIDEASMAGTTDLARMRFTIDLRARHVNNTAATHADFVGHRRSGVHKEAATLLTPGDGKEIEL